MENKEVWVIGHKNPDTDSVCAAIAYADYKNQLEARKNEEDKITYVPKLAGKANGESAFVLKQFHKKAPAIVDGVGTQIKDITIRKTEGVDGHISMKKAWELMKILNVVTLPVVNSRGKLEGLIVTGDIAKSYMDEYGSELLSTARTQYKNIIETLEGRMLAGNEHGYFVKGNVSVAAGTAEVIANALNADDLVIIGDRKDSQLQAIEANCSCIVVTNGCEVDASVLEKANAKDVVVISTPYDTFTTARLINQSAPIRHFMTKENIIHFHSDDYVNEVKDAVTKIRHRDFPVLDENENYIGMISRRNLMSSQKKQVILVDHNEKSQTVNNMDEAEILEIIDHHRLGSLETIAPLYFRNQPLGCTSTIIYQMYQEKGLTISPDIAGLLCAAIISDTLMFRSPTCTDVDRDAAEELAKIAGIDIEEFALSMFTAGSDYSKKTAKDIMMQDFKIFHTGDVDFAVAQVNVMSAQEMEMVKKKIEPKFKQVIADKQIDMLFVMLTNILTETTLLVYEGVGADVILKSAYQEAPQEGVLLKGVVSRKKQLIPVLMNTFAEL